MKLRCNTVLSWVQLEMQLHSISTIYFLFIKHTNIPSMVPTKLYTSYLPFKVYHIFMCFFLRNSTQDNNFILIISGWNINWYDYTCEWMASWPTTVLTLLLLAWFGFTVLWSYIWDFLPVLLLAWISHHVYPFEWSQNRINKKILTAVEEKRVLQIGPLEVLWFYCHRGLYTRK